MDATQIAKNWKHDEPILRNLGEKVVSFLQDALYQKEMHPEVSFRTKEIQSIIKKIKRKSQQKQYTYNDLRDKLGVRIICPFLSDLEVVDEIIKSSFIIRKVEKKRENIDFNRLDYQSNHYDVSINSEYIDFNNDAFVFEIQVRTLNQHAWANSAHILYYKQDIELPDEMKHRIYRLLSLYELADEEFSKVNEYLKTHKEDLVYTLLRKLEGKIYKYALTDFDRDLSIKQMELILDFFTPEDQRKIETEIELFITENNQKIQHIFNDNRNRYADITFLTQPEIFVIFWGLSNSRFSITDNWCFDEDELESIQNLWC
ncbi:GTP pyrophosphokinase [Prevotella koreensis]